MKGYVYFIDEKWLKSFNKRQKGIRRIMNMATFIKHERPQQKKKMWDEWQKKFGK